ncbi:hypothetical protein Mapa_016758 [Marchantia paleacea]|nr:hypothetical protein Mapa_016758 [Marchantia paleacea]
MIRKTTRNLSLMAAFAATIAIFSSVAAAKVYECDYVNECGLDVHVEVSQPYKSKYGYKGVDGFYLHDNASKLVSYTLEKLLYPFDLGGIFWDVKAIVNGEELVAKCYLPLDAKVLITKGNGRVCAEVYVYRKILHKYIISSVVYLH